MSLKSYSKDAAFPPVQSTTLRLYSMRFCPYAQRTRLVLEHKNIPYEEINIDLKSKPDWFLERNPLGLVPTIEKGGKILYESTATCEWVDDVYPSPKMTSSDPFQKAQDRMLLEYFSKITSVFYTKLMKEELKEAGLVELHKHFNHLETFLAQREGPLFGGASPCLLDFYIWPHFERLHVFSLNEPRFYFSEKEHPAMTKWHSYMCELPAVKKILFSPETHNHFIKSYFTGKPDYDYGL